MPLPFFPNPIAAWIFFAVLMALLAVASVVDIRTAKIPKPLTLTIVAAGIIANIIRGGTMDSLSWGTGKFDPSGFWGGVWVGMLDGLIFSLLGLITAFTIFFGMWMLGVCGGGDVKLCAGIGAWVGSVYTVYLLLASVIALLIWMAAKVIAGGKTSLKSARQTAVPAKGNHKKAGLPRNRMTFSFPAAMAAAAVMLWVFRFDLQLTPWPQAPDNEAKHASAAPFPR